MELIYCVTHNINTDGIPEISYITVPTSIKVTTCFGALKMMTTLRGLRCFVNINAINRISHGRLGMKIIIVCLPGTNHQLNETSSEMKKRPNRNFSAYYYGYVSILRSTNLE